MKPYTFQKLCIYTILGFLLFSFLSYKNEAKADDAKKIVTNAMQVSPLATPDPLSGPTEHPRLWLRQKDLPMLRSWATMDNPLYVVFKERIDKIKKDYNAEKNSLGCVDDGVVTFPGCPIEVFSMYLSFDSLINPDPAKREESAKMAHDIFMPVMTEIAKGVDEASKYRVATFFYKDRARVLGHAFPLTVDWIYHTFSPSERLTVRNALLMWEYYANLIQGLINKTDGWLYKNPKIISNKLALRWIANNYRMGYFKMTALNSLVMDPADDPPIDPNLPSNAIGNTLRSFQHMTFGAWLPEHLALFFGGEEVYKKIYKFFGVPYPSDLNYFGGDGADGMSLEGGPFFYAGDAFGAQLDGYLGIDSYLYEHQDLEKFGPGLEMLPPNDFWRKNVEGWLHSIAPGPTTLKGAEWIGDVYEVAHYGQIHSVFAPVTNIGMFSKLALLARKHDDKELLNATKWILVHALPGGQKEFLKRAKASNTIELFLAFDPNDHTPITDPRPSLGLDFLVKPQARILSRTSWNLNASWFSFVCSFATIDHQMGNCNMFTFYRKGEWMTKERDGYAVALPNILDTTDYQNALSVQNTYLMEKPAAEVLDRGTYDRGGQFLFSAGEPTVQTSLNQYVYANSDATNRYNRKVNSGDALDVKHVSRSILWIKPDHIVIYDRAETGLEQKFKRFNLNLTAVPSIEGNKITVTTPKGQNFYVTSVLPENRKIEYIPFEKDNLDPYGNAGKFRLFIQNPSQPKSIRFLNVLQGSDAGVPSDAVKHVQSSAGTPYEGVSVGNATVMFLVNFTDKLTQTEFEIPSLTDTLYLTGLEPKGKYTIAVHDNGNKNSVSVSQGGNDVADEGGVILKEITANENNENMNDPKAESTAKSVFADMSISDPHYDAILELKNLGIVEGYPDGSFRPDQLVKRVESLKMNLLVGKIFVPMANGTAGFLDLDPLAWYAKYIVRAVQLKIAEGYPDLTFKPGRTVNLVESLKLLLKSQKIDVSRTQVSKNPYHDAFADQWYAKYVQFAKEKHLIDADANNRIHPGKPMTRAEVAEVLYRLLYIKKNGLQTYP